MVTRRIGVKHTRRQRHRHRHHAKTKKKLSKRYRGKKGYSKRITRRHVRRSHDTDIINTQDGGTLTILSAAKTAAGKELELKIISRYLLKNINKIINDYVRKQGISLEQFYINISDPLQRKSLPPKIISVLDLQHDVIYMSNTAAHDLPHEILSRYNELFPEDEDKDVSLVTGKAAELEDDENGDKIVRDDVADNDDKLDILTGIRTGNVSIKAKQIEYGRDPMSASIDSGDAVTFLGHIFNPSDVPFIMIVVFYTKFDYALPQLQQQEILELSKLGVETDGKTRPGNIIFVRKIVRINMTAAGDTLCGNLTPGAKIKILMDLRKASEYVKSDDEKIRAEGNRICEEVDAILTRAESFLRASTKKNDPAFAKNRIQARVALDLHDLKDFCEVDNKPVMSPLLSLVSTPTAVKSKKGNVASFADIVLQVDRRSNRPTPFSKHFTLEEFAGKKNQIGEIVMDAMRKDPNYIQHLKRVYFAQRHLTYYQSQYLMRQICQDHHFLRQP